MGNITLTGFNENEVYKTIQSLESAYQALHAAIKNRLQNGFIIGMQDKWACNEAQEFFRNVVQPQFEEIIKVVNENFTVIDEGINEAARLWALETKSQYTKRHISRIETKIDVSMIQENIGGTRGIDKVEASSLVSHLKQFDLDASSALSSAKNAVIDCGLFGGAQEQNLQEVLEKNKSIIGNYITNLIQLLEKAINSTVSSYGDTEGKISQAFNIN